MLISQCANYGIFIFSHFHIKYDLSYNNYCLSLNF